ncbi:PTS lactose transporter subunit IIBC [Lactobacillus sp. ESL0677]|uniref:PTS lactose transporter subunit IIBC n=1 Tax=Lactobacillus sp. ESL0677 TaxID=2983208 RepID=UPI0023F73F00|nr:PTS lactose transporter subunit IIBC [Lactobacillus sp. ESL0677]WEV37324.1 PTS lactose transporter subunit IIBC [Lactobacillus sp. ESL0677]
MNGFTKVMDKMKPSFEKIAANPYVSAIRDGFIAAMPIILFSSLFTLFAYVPNSWGFYWPKEVENAIMLPYNYSMGLLGLFVTATCAKNLTDYKNTGLPKTNQINAMNVILAAEISFIIIAIKVGKTGIDLTFLGTQGLIASYIVGLIIPNIYSVCVKHNITINMPDQVPQNISQTFKDIFPMAFSVGLFWIIQMVLAKAFGANLSECIINLLSPLFRAGDTYGGLALIAGAMAFFWFIGVQGPSIVTPAVAAIEMSNVGLNQQLMHAGVQATHVLVLNTQDYVMNMGGTGSTLIVPFLFLLLAKSEQNKAVGKAAVIPGCFSVNEPILFGAPIIMNPVFFVPFLITPMFNVCLFKFFVSTLHMNSIIATLPWTVPAPIGIIVGTGFAPLSFVYVILALIADVLIWLPFFRFYDNDLYKKEQADAAKLVTATDTPAQAVTENVSLNSETTTETQTASDETLTQDTNIMVICAGGGTSGILAKALNKMAKERNLPLHAAARAYGQHMDIIHDMDLIILAPQMDSMKDNLAQIANNDGSKLVTTTGRQYIELTQNPDQAFQFVMDSLKNDEGDK